MKLIVNADDFGYTEGISEGIIYANKFGIVTSTTALMNMEDIEEHLKKVEDCDNLGVGVHLTLTLGKSITKNKTLTDSNGYFHNRKNIDFSKLDKDEVYQEWKAQINRYIDITGKLPTHFDSHHHVHAVPELIDVTKRLSEEFSLKVRDFSDYTVERSFYGENISINNLIENLDKYEKSDRVELMNHCGFPDIKLRKLSTYTNLRLKEINILCSDEIKNFIEEKGIELVSY